MKKLTLSLWKYLKTSVGSDFKQWDKYVAAAKKYKLIDYAAKIAVESMEVLAPLMLGETLPKLAEIYQDERDKIRVMPHAQASFDRLLKTRERDWELHERITYEALELLLKSSSFSEIRHRLACCLVHPVSLSKMPGLEIHNITTPQWHERLSSYVTLSVVMIFLGVDWISIFGEKTKN